MNVSWQRIQIERLELEGAGKEKPLTKSILKGRVEECMSFSSE